MGKKLGRVRICARVSPEVKRSLFHLKADTGVDVEDIVEAAVRVLLAVVKEDSVPNELAEVLTRHDPDTFRLLSGLVERVKRGDGIW